MQVIPLANRGARSGLRPNASRPRGRLAEIFAYADPSVKPIPDLAAAVYEIRASHPCGADIILIGVSDVQGMKIIQDWWGITVLIGLSPSRAQVFSPEAGDEVTVVFDHGALRPAGVIGFLWEGENAPDSSPPESNSGATQPRLNAIRHLRRLQLP